MNSTPGRIAATRDAGPDDAMVRFGGGPGAPTSVRGRIPGRLGVLLVAMCLVQTSIHGASTPRPPEVPPLSTTSGGKRIPGKFVWADLITDDLPAATRFYGGLFGWRFQPIHGAYVIAAMDERPLAGILQRSPPKDRPAKPRWFGYLSVTDIDRVTAVVTKPPDSPQVTPSTRSSSMERTSRAAPRPAPSIPAAPRPMPRMGGRR